MKKEVVENWFSKLRDTLIKSYEEIEKDYAVKYSQQPAKFKKKQWTRPGGGGGEMAIMYGKVFEKVGVNISIVHGKLDEQFRNSIPGTEDNLDFYATGISIVAHMFSPLVPSTHFNTRYIVTDNKWFGGGGDLTPVFEDIDEKKKFHQSFKEVCDKYNPTYYSKFSKACDEYFYIKHRKEARGIGGIFYDNLNTGNIEKDFEFTKDIGRAFSTTYPQLVRDKMFLNWSEIQKNEQLIKRGKYVEFNLLYDRGTKFGLMTDGNVEAIFMSMPPYAKWE